jgi:transposase
MATRPKVTDWTEDEVKSTLLKGWARNGLTNEQIAANMGISKVTFYEWRNKFPNFANLIKEDKDYADTQVENALYKQALEGNVTAAIFWLKNRRRNNWKDKQDVEVSGEVGIVDAMIRKANERKERLENES